MRKVVDFWRERMKVDGPSTFAPSTLMSAIVTRQSGVWLCLTLSLSQVACFDDNELPDQMDAQSDNVDATFGDVQRGDTREMTMQTGVVTFVVLPDTQFYSAAFPEIFEAQTQWIVKQKQSLGIAMVLHEGDIVDSDVGAQWQRASKSLHRLDGVVPYVLAAGNHDMTSGPLGLEREPRLMNQFFPLAGFAKSPLWGGTFEPDRVENSYQFVEVGNERWLIMALEFGPRNQVLEWASGVLASHAQLPAVLVTHAYMNRDGTRFDNSRVAPQLFNPHFYGLDRFEGGVNDGEEIFKKLVINHDNLRLVLSGHDLYPGVARQTSRRPSGSEVHEVLANFQACAGLPCRLPDGSLTLGGDGFLRLLTFDLVNRVLSVRTYSPYVNRFKEDPSNSFDLQL